MTNDQLTHTVAEMYRLIDRYDADVSDFPYSPGAIFDRVRRIPYVRDSVRCNAGECVMRPAYGLHGGDCDDKAIIAGAALKRAGIPFRIVTTSYRDDGQMQHTYLEIAHADRWVPFDATYAHNRIGTEKPFTQKLTWDNPMLASHRHNVTTLEGYLGEPPAGTTPPINPAPGTGTGPPINAEAWTNLFQTLGQQVRGGSFSIRNAAIAASPMVFAAIGTHIMGPLGPLFGGFISGLLSLINMRGATQHLTQEESEQKALDMTDPFLELYNKLPQDGKAVVLEASENFFRSMWATYRTWWPQMDCNATWGCNSGYLERYRNHQHQTYPLLSTPYAVVKLGLNGRQQNPTAVAAGRVHVRENLFGPLYVFFRGKDLQHLTNDFNAEIKNRYQTLMIDPIIAFLKLRYNQTIEQFVGTGGGGTTPPAPPAPPASTGLSMPTILGIASLALMLFNKK